MSLPKIGSVVAIAPTANGTRCCHSRTVSQAAPTAAAMTTAATTAMAASPAVARGPRSGTESVSNVIARGSPGRLAP